MVNGRFIPAINYIQIRTAPVITFIFIVLRFYGIFYGVVTKIRRHNKRLAIMRQYLIIGCNHIVTWGIVEILC